MKRKDIYLILVVAIGFSLILNEVNRHYIKENNPENITKNAGSLVQGYTVWSIDNNSYLAPVENFFKGYGYTRDPENEYMRVRRTPGYSIFFGIHYFLFGTEYAYFFIRYTQILLFALSAVLLAKTVWHLTENAAASKITGYTYAICPFVAGFNYYTITEAIHPAFLIISIYFFASAFKNDKWYLFLFTGFFIGITVMIRPVSGIILIVIGMVFFIQLIMHRLVVRKLFLQGGVLAGGFILILLPWTIRNYIVTDGEIIILEKFYNEDPMMMGKGHAYFRKWWYCWSISESELIFPEMVDNSINNALADKWVNKFVNNLPDVAFKGYGKEEVIDALRSLLSCHRYKVNGNGFHMPNPDRQVVACDEETKAKFLYLINQYKKTHPIRYWIILPAHFIKEFIFQSNSGSLAMLNPERREFNVLQKTVKGGMYISNILLYLSLFFFLFGKEKTWLKFLITSFPFITLIYLCVFFRHIETRYMLQCYFAMFISFGLVIEKYFSFFNIRGKIFKIL